mmetsp:Transcript_21071/g.35869  ORF Transcript_21071/g.35869 Transcript_21071/m.35869 type:complete len:200 (+) Transcript_21071:92-691(+)
MSETQINVVKPEPQVTYVNNFLNLLRDSKSATNAIAAHNQLAAVLVDIKMLSPGSSIVHRGKVQKAVSKYEDAEREEFSHLIEVRNKVLPDAEEPFTFHGAKFRKKLLKPSLKVIDHDLRSRWEDLSKALHYEEMEVQEEADDLEVVDALQAMFKRADALRSLIEKLELTFVRFRHEFIRAINQDFASFRQQYNVKVHG